VKSQVQFVSVGHCCHDKLDDKFILGGSASYASFVAQQLKCKSSIITSFGPDFLFRSEFERFGIELKYIPSIHTTIFENTYLPQGRVQYIHNTAAYISKDEINDSEMPADILLLCPIANEVDIDILDLYPNSLKGASIQGWLRSWGRDKKINSSIMDWSLLAGLDIVIISQEDIEYSKQKLRHIIEAVSHVVLTDGMNGATVFIEKKEFKFPVFPVNEVEATGAGDVFATAYLYQFHKTSDVEKSCVFAHCAASFIVEGIGIRNLPTMEKIMDRVGRYGLMSR